MKKIAAIIINIAICTPIFAQLSTNERPISFSLTQEMLERTKSVTMPPLDMRKIEMEDKEDEEYDMPPRFGYPHKVNYNLNNSGTWTELPNGDRLWQLNVICPGALSVNFCYDKFWIPEGGKFFVYSTDRKHTIGAFTSMNNKGDRERIRGFATGLVYGSDVMLEYYQPKEVTADAIISIDFVVHGYRYINIEETGFGTSGECQVNVNCEEGQDWQNEKRAVALILVNGNRYCTGALINTTDLSQKPYFLTANHCVSSYGDADGISDLDFYSFYWNYETPGCYDVDAEPTYLSTSGATILANNLSPDFALLQLTESPNTLSNFTPFYLGWDCSGQSDEAGVCIHHPAGDVKKISTVAGQPTSSFWSNKNIDGGFYWKVAWKETLNGHGTTQKGSSGSPLLAASHKVIGQLRGGTSNICNNPTNSRSYYGKFSVSWTGNNNDSICRRLNYWLDPQNLGIQTMEGLLLIPATTALTTGGQLFGNIRITSSGQLTVYSDIELMGNSQVIVESGGKLIIDGGKFSNVDLVLKAGSYLQIINGGIIETMNGFAAPIGAIVDVEYGQIR